MKVKELKPILKHLDDDLEVNFAIVSNKKDNKRTSEEIYLSLDAEVYDECFWS